MQQHARTDARLTLQIQADQHVLKPLLLRSFLREAELKHCRVAMLAAAGAIAQDVYQFPGTVQTFGTPKMTALHDVAVTKGTMAQMAWPIGFLELFSAVFLVQVCLPVVVWHSAAAVRTRYVREGPHDCTVASDGIPSTKLLHLILFASQFVVCVVAVDVRVWITEICTWMLRSLGESMKCNHCIPSNVNLCERPRIRFAWIQSIPERENSLQSMHAGFHPRVTGVGVETSLGS